MKEVVAYLKHIDDSGMKLVRLAPEIEIKAIESGPSSDLALELEVQKLQVVVNLWDELLKGMYAVFTPYMQLYRHHVWLVRFVARVKRWVDSEQPSTLATRYDV